MTSPKLLVYNNIYYPMYNIYQTREINLSIYDNIYYQEYIAPHKMDGNSKPMKRQRIK